MGCHSLATINITNSQSSIAISALPSCLGYGLSLGPGHTPVGLVTCVPCAGTPFLTLPDTVTSINSQAFYECTDVVSITIPDSVTSVGELAFHVTTGLSSIYVSDSITSVGDRAFPSCLGFGLGLRTGNNPRGNITCIPCSHSVVTIPDTVVTIGQSAFQSCVDMVGVVISDSVTAIGINAFSWSDNLVAVNIPDSVTTIGGGAFRPCLSLTSARIPSQISIAGDAFELSGCAATSFVAGALLCNCNQGSCEPTPSPTSPPTYSPTGIPSTAPTSAPTALPTEIPTSVPTRLQTASPTQPPTTAPTRAPVFFPTAMPTLTPTTRIPTVPAPTDGVEPSTQPTTTGVSDHVVSSSDGTSSAPLIAGLTIGVLIVAAAAYTCGRRHANPRSRAEIPPERMNTVSMFINPAHHAYESSVAAQDYEEPVHLHAGQRITMDPELYVSSPSAQHGGADTRPTHDSSTGYAVFRLNDATSSAHHEMTNSTSTYQVFRRADESAL